MSLKNKTISGVAWNGAGNLARQILTVVTLIVMARFLSPDDFGIFAILMIFVTFMNIFASMGTSQAVIHLDDPDQRMLSSIFYFNLLMGVVLFGLLYVLAWPISAFFEQPSLVHLLQLVGLTFILTTVSLVQKALLEKA
ncbi:MAG: oligosaccharide flippase family protein, partial [Methyloprofundus sp.]|nr:oligosaccharide flippase family protein [Methyloprofundus sp.]